MTPKFKKGKLFLYQHSFHNMHFNDIPVLTLCINKNYPTWLCLFPDGSTGGCHPSHLKDITVKDK